MVAIFHSKMGKINRKAQQPFVSFPLCFFLARHRNFYCVLIYTSSYTTQHNSMPIRILRVLVFCASNNYQRTQRKNIKYYRKVRNKSEIFSILCGFLCHPTAVGVFCTICTSPNLQTSPDSAFSRLSSSLALLAEEMWGHEESSSLLSLYNFLNSSSFSRSFYGVECQIDVHTLIVLLVLSLSSLLLKTSSMAQSLFLASFRGTQGAAAARSSLMRTAILSSGQSSSPSLSSTSPLCALVLPYHLHQRRNIQTVRKGATYRYQDSLPRLSIPPLEDTLKNYLNAVKPLVPEKDFMYVLEIHLRITYTPLPARSGSFLIDHS